MAISYRVSQTPGDGDYPYNLGKMSRNSWVENVITCLTKGGLVSGNAKGNKDIQKEMQKTAGTKNKAI